MLCVLLTLLVLLAGGPSTASGAEAWSRPVDGDVVASFRYDAAAPFAAGQHRGVDFAARHGESVRAPCSGPVTFAGRVPDRGRGVTIRCGALAATLVELAAVRVARSSRVVLGESVGRAAGRVHLGARRTGERFGYLDPLALLGTDPSPLGPAPAPTRRPPEVSRRLAPAAERGTGPRPTAAPLVTPRPAAGPSSMPLPAWIGLSLVAAGLPLGAIVRRRRLVGRLREVVVGR